jgi:hypothetical protein
MEIKTEDQRVTTIKFFDDEVRHYINHPQELVPVLTRATGIVPSDIILTPRKPAKHKADSVKPVAKSVRPRKSGGKFECKHCHRGFKRAGNRDRHEPTCTNDIEIGEHQPGD